ncbi:MAG: hypothetical protein ACREF1_11060, partial [Acetobacteraceae bacterium]
MADLSITLTLADYSRLMPLTTGEVAPDGIALTLQLGRRGSWPDRAEMLRRALHDPAVQGGEQSMAGHLIRVDRGDRSHVGLPVFPLRNFTARDLYVRKGSAVHDAAGLAGARIGMYGWANSGSIWYRHFLRWLGVDLDRLQWWIGDIDAQRVGSVAALPPRVNQPPVGRSLSEMLIAGELDAIYSPPRPLRYHPTDGPIVRLFPEFRSLEQRYFRETGAFPPQHLIVLRRAVWEANPWIANSLTDAFIRCNDAFTASQRGFPYATPWLEAELEDTTALMGEDYHPYGLERNRAQIEMFCRTGFEAGLTQKLVSVDDYFAEFRA